MCGEFKKDSFNWFDKFDKFDKFHKNDAAVVFGNIPHPGEKGLTVPVVVDWFEFRYEHWASQSSISKRIIIGSDELLKPKIS